MNVLDNMVVPDIPVPSGVSQSAAAVVQDNDDKFLLVCSRDLEAEEMELLSTYGKVLRYDECHLNIPLSQLVDGVSYVIFDVRQKSHRLAMSKEAENEHFHSIAVIHKWEQFDDFVDDANCLVSLGSIYC